MDEREQELNALREYGFKLLEKMRYPELLEMLHGTLTHLHDIAAEYSTEANTWRARYNECEAHNQKLQQQLQDLETANNEQVDKLKEAIKIQSDTITDLEKDFNRKLGELRSYRDSEVQNYNKQIQALILAQQSLDGMKQELEENLRKCESERKRLERLQLDLERERADLQRQIDVNKTKLDRYDELDVFQRNAQGKIDELEQALIDLQKELASERKRNQELNDTPRNQSASDEGISASQVYAEKNFSHNDDEDETK